ncbi:TetR/AcrR family transcriptional regulator [Corynebacterium oculi]|uniref:HTH-type transcriptional repressor NicS n=1 Tax=Corynebacterium oculi TaxID=1544416 RepID=A0A0Q0U1A4_9CORY|nr:TetR family transcriptional regulator [Corynebacterium oculi]KQB85516.1 HTH-type transcriptional repressor NicS [Corynebacterium oculi]
MARDTEKTKQRILDAALTEFTEHGPDGTTVERIARSAGVNKERIYNYFGNKHALFAHILDQEMTSATTALPVPSTGAADIGEYAGNLYDYLEAHPALLRLLQWEALTLPAPIPGEQQRTHTYAQRTAEFREGQRTGTFTDTIDAAHLNILILGIAGYWHLLPQVTRMIAAPDEAASRRAAVVEAARRLVTP